MQNSNVALRSAAGESNSFGMEVGQRQGSDVLTDDVRKDVPGSMTFADDIVLPVCGDDETGMSTWIPG